MTTTIPKQDPRSYNASLEQWLPPQARTLATQGDLLAERLMIVFRRYRYLREPDDWREFVELRRQFIAEHGEEK